MLIGEAILRANPAYDLVPLDRLSVVERQALAEEADRERAPYGLLRPTSESPLEPRIVSTDTALLFLTLMVPGPCPGYLRSGLGDRLTATLGRLVLDGILEVEVDGVFRSGAAGWAPLAPAGEGRRGGRTAALSEEAIRYGDALLTLGSLPSETIATRLYMYGRRPVNPALRRLVASWDPLGGAGPTLSRQWSEQQQASPDSPWRSWQPRRSPTRRTRSSSPFKLYVSPTTETLPEAVRAVASALADAPGVLGFKIGKTVDGVARPDKMVAYFSSLDDLHGGRRSHPRSDGRLSPARRAIHGRRDRRRAAVMGDRSAARSHRVGPPCDVLELADVGLDAARRLPHRRSLERRGRDARSRRRSVAGRPGASPARRRRHGQLGAGSSHLRRRGARLRPR